MAASPISNDDLEALLASAEDASNAWMRGDFAPYLALSSQSDDYTIMGPLGGPAIQGFKAYSQRAPQIARNFRNGSSKVRLVEHYASGDLLVLVMEEEQSGELAGGGMQPWSLRVTQVCRREAGEWKVVHRHADPLVRMRSMAEAANLASK